MEEEDTQKVDCSRTEVQTPALGFSRQRLLLFTSFIHLDITSGVVLLDKHQGFWLVHSTPHFPPARKAGQYYYPGSGLINGQNFICVTYPLERFQTIGKTEVVERFITKSSVCHHLMLLSNQVTCVCYIFLLFAEVKLFTWYVY